jgi:hypothetical protein
MNTRQQQLRSLAEQLTHSNNATESLLAHGTLDLLDYINELHSAIDATTEACCEAVYLAYEFGETPSHSRHQEQLWSSFHTKDHLAA